MNIKSYKVFISGVWLALLLVANLGIAQTSDKIFPVGKLDAYIGKTFAEWKIPALAIAIVHNNKVVLNKGYGNAVVENNLKADGNTLFAIASNTKAFTATALANLVADGKISWDDPVVKYIPYFKMYNPYVTAEMRIRDLLCHRSGLETFSGDLLWYGSTYSREEIIRRIPFLLPKYPFRTSFGYSNLMFLVAGQIVEAVTGNTWDAYMQQQFFTKLEMTNSNTSITQFTADNKIATPYHVDLLNNTTVPLKYINWDNIAPAGSINSCTNDMAKWMTMLLNNGEYNKETIIDAKQLSQMMQMHTPNEVSAFSRKNWPSINFKGYGLGFALNDYHGHTIVSHGGGADGMISKVVLVPDESFGFVILTNSINSLPSALTYYILDLFFTGKSADWSTLFLENTLIGLKTEADEMKEAEANRNKTSVPSLSLEKYTGLYTSELYGDAQISIVNNKLYLKLIPTPMFQGELLHWQYNTFSIKFNNIVNLPQGTVNFTLNNSGVIDNMLIEVKNPDFDFTELRFVKQN